MVKAMEIIIKDMSKVLEVMVNAVKVMVKVLVRVLVVVKALAFKSHLHLVFMLCNLYSHWELLVPSHYY